MKLLALTIFLILAFSLLATAQKKFKPWQEWNEKEALKMLNDSPWGQTQTETNTSEMFYSPTASGGGTTRGAASTGNSGGLTGGNDRNAQGALNQAVNINFRIRFLSAKPVREAFARRVILQNPQMEAQLKAFAEQTSNEWIVVAVDYDSSDQRFTGRVMQTFNSANLGLLANATYLERKDGKRLFLKDYKAPISDGMGAKFIFPRAYEDKPFITEDSGYVRFYSEVGKDFKLNMRFKVPEMMYNGKLEY
ncbi:MAG: hypothetical protein HYR56_02050 [Acidobacteria bacterium]|nr:hypothetical protein [Acidobacteriota bacterium]MBI3421945.1 hypothetical protein [Acidobacteriota bacterium]